MVAGGQRQLVPRPGRESDTLALRQGPAHPATTDTCTGNGTHESPAVLVAAGGAFAEGAKSSASLQFSYRRITSQIACSSCAHAA